MISSSSLRPIRKWPSPLVFVLVAATLFHILTIRDGHSWGDDFAQYILHAQNLARGLPYTDIGYIQNPVDPAALLVGPPAYPPLAPILLAPVYALFGLSFPPMKGLLVVVMIASLYAIYIYFRDEQWLTVLIALIAFHPLLWEAKENVGSDLFFLGLVYASLIQIDRLMLSHLTSLKGWILLGVCLYMTCAARSVGLTLLPVAPALALLHRRNLTPALLATGIALALVTVQDVALDTGRSYLQDLQATISIATLRSNVIDYPKELVAVWVNGQNFTVAKILYLLSLPFVVAGLWIRLQRGLKALELYLLFYVLTILLWPSFQGTRFLLPVLPAFITYLMISTELLHGVSAKTLRLGLGALLCVTYLVNYYGKDRAIDTTGFSQPEFISLCDFVKANTQSTDHLLFRKPRALTLRTGRPAAIYNSGAGDSATWDLIRLVNARYLVLADLSTEDFRADQTILRPFIARYADAFEMIYKNRTFSLYRVR